jgi:hypothetical protein
MTPQTMVAQAFIGTSFGWFGVVAFVASFFVGFPQWAAILLAVGGAGLWLGGSVMYVQAANSADSLGKRLRAPWPAEENVS